MNRNVLPIWACNPCGVRAADPTCWMCLGPCTDMGATTTFLSSREGGYLGVEFRTDTPTLTDDPCGGGPL